MKFPSPALHHLRGEAGRHEIDLIADLGAGRILAFEFKGAAPTAADAKHLMWLRDEIGDALLGGVVLHTSRAQVELGDRIAALPIAAIWG